MKLSEVNIGFGKDGEVNRSRAQSHCHKIGESSCIAACHSLFTCRIPKDNLCRTPTSTIFLVKTLNNSKISNFSEQLDDNVCVEEKKTCGLKCKKLNMTLRLATRDLNKDGF